MSRTTFGIATLLLLTQSLVAPSQLAAQVFQPQMQLGGGLPGDQWEPAIAALRLRAA